MRQPLADIVEEATRVLETAAARGAQVRALGGIAVRLHAADDLPAALVRSCNDIDLAAPAGGGRAAAGVLVELGYAPARQFNALNGSRRLLFHDTGNERQLDVFVGAFEMCHRIPFGTRLAVEEPTIPLAELLLTKLQIVELNEKDLRDIVALLRDHPVGQGDDETINAGVVASLTAADWGLWRTTKLNLERLRVRLADYPLAAAERALVQSRADELWQRVESEPKSTRWRLRQRVGDRMRWYEQPDEVH